MGVCERESERERVELRVCLWACEGETRRLFAFVLVCLWRKEKGRERERKDLWAFEHGDFGLCMKVCVCVCARMMMCERERNKEREKGKNKHVGKRREYLWCVSAAILFVSTTFKFKEKKLGRIFFYCQTPKKHRSRRHHQKKSTLLFRRKNDSPAKVFKKRSKRRTSFTRK